MCNREWTWCRHWFWDSNTILRTCKFELAHLWFVLWLIYWRLVNHFQSSSASHTCESCDHWSRHRELSNSMNLLKEKNNRESTIQRQIERQMTMCSVKNFNKASLVSFTLACELLWVIIIDLIYYIVYDYIKYIKSMAIIHQFVLEPPSCCVCRAALPMNTFSKKLDGLKKLMR